MLKKSKLESGTCRKGLLLPQILQYSVHLLTYSGISLVTVPFQHFVSIIVPLNFVFYLEIRLSALCHYGAAIYFWNQIFFSTLNCYLVYLYHLVILWNRILFFGVIHALNFPPYFKDTCIYTKNNFHVDFRYWSKEYFNLQ
jgi:hypothetical protein